MIGIVTPSATSITISGWKEVEVLPVTDTTVIRGCQKMDIELMDELGCNMYDMIFPSGGAGNTFAFRITRTGSNYTFQASNDYYTSLYIYGVKS